MPVQKTIGRASAAKVLASKARTAKAPRKKRVPGTPKRPPTRGRRKPAPAGSMGLAPTDVASIDDGATRALAQQLELDGGLALARYRDPLYGKPVVFAVLPLAKVERTTFQRDVSEPHVDRLVDAMRRTGAYLDPVIVVRAHDGTWRSPNGGHRLAALTRLGAKSVVALVTPDEKLAFKILALNTEKAHVLKERSLEAIRMLRALAALGEKLLDDERRHGSEEAFAGELEEPQLATLGAAYEKRARLSGSAYNPLLKRADGWLSLPLPEALTARQRRAEVLLAFDDVVTPLVESLRERGFDTPGLRSVVLSRLVRLPQRGQKLPGTFEEIFARAIEKARSFDVSSIAHGDLAAGLASATDE